MLVRKHSSYFDHLDSRPVQVVHIPSIPQGRDCLLTSLIQLILIPSGINFRALSLTRYWKLSILRRRKDSERNSHLLLVSVGSLCWTLRLLTWCTLAGGKKHDCGRGLRTCRRTTRLGRALTEPFVCGLVVCWIVADPWTSQRVRKAVWKPDRQP